MTRRTDWAEYEYAFPGAPRGRGTGGRPGSAADGEDGHRHGGPRDDGHGDDGYADGGYGESGRRGAYSEYGGRDACGGSDAYGSDGGHGGDGGGRPEAVDGGPRRAGSPGRGSGAGGPRGDGPRGGGRRRGRRRGFGDAPGEDEDALPSSRAERGESSGDPAERARAICLRLLTGTPRTRKQLADALRKREIPDDVADEVLSRFEEVGLIDDGAFADAWVESRHHGRGLAGRALARELRTKGVDSSLIDEAVSQLDSEQEEATARELVARKLHATRGLDRDKRLRRLAGMLARKGYSEGLALRIVRQALEEEGEDTEFLEGGDLF
ncbi:recombination regulator RecX [Streptomyces dangxiongensis]|uniref:Regulatory protein RecX n=1 Tax=Streptomyces dangxiongensis TaxID=1442032 RepID=A0A3G2JCF5_9ACTN|nr:recombination regulator RecX [Streptomyces dangxiongensis]AYN39075.1 recombination regulator RecX [Streptomyces dangxiongensis]